MRTPEESGLRTDPPRVADERTMYQAWLDYHRGTLLWKCDGLDAAQLRSASVEPSRLTLLGLVRHMAEVERGWFRDGWDGVAVEQLYSTDEWPDADFEDLEGADVAADLQTFRAECAAADRAVASRGLDDEVRGRSGKPISLRWIYVHMIEEYARHNGHADLIRERIDGQTGD
jgi:uncharacterized damage-inducible protein DinB